MLSSGLYSLTRDVKYQNNQNNMITLREKWELHKTGSFGNFAIIAKFRYHSENCRHSENLNFAMHSNFRYDSENLAIAKIR